MPNRIGGILSLVAFAMCIVVGVTQASNSFVTVLERALYAMVGTYVVGYLVGVALEKMVQENVAAMAKKKSEIS